MVGFGDSGFRLGVRRFEGLRPYGFGSRSCSANGNVLHRNRFSCEK